MWKEWLEAYGGRALGILAGLFCAVIYLISGFWDMLFCILLVGLGYGIGYNKDKKRGPLLPWDRLVSWMSDRWPWPR